MRVKIVNVYSRTIGGPTGEPINPGEAIEAELNEHELKIWEGFKHAEIHRLDRPQGGGNKKAAKGADD